MTATHPAEPPGRILDSRYAATTIGMFSLIAFAAFEVMAVTTVMPTVARELSGQGLYALAFAAPLASGVIGTVAAGMWCDRRGPSVPLVAAMVVFSIGLLVCGSAPAMEVLVLGRILQGLGGGALTVGLYVLVGLVYPARLQPAVFASFAAAWVLPSLFGPALAAFVASTLNWRWVFLGAVIFVALSGLLVAPALRGRTDQGSADSAPLSRLGWATVAAGAVLGVELLGSAAGWWRLAAAAAFVVVILALRPLLPKGTLLAGRGLPAVIGTRGMLAGSFFSVEAYIVYVLQEQWGLTPTTAGLALTGVGVMWAVGSQAQSKLGERISHSHCMVIGTWLVLLGGIALAITVALELPAILAALSYIFAGTGMGFGYPRTGVALLDVSTDADRGFNSSAIAIAESLGAALTISVAGVLFAIAQDSGHNPFLAVFVMACAVGALGVPVARRTA